MARRKKGVFVMYSLASLEATDPREREFLDANGYSYVNNSMDGVMIYFHNEEQQAAHREFMRETGLNMKRRMLYATTLVDVIV